MPSLLQFVGSIAASPTVRLDLNDGSTWKMLEGTEFPPPPLREVVAQTMLADGGVIPSSAYDLRTLTLVLGLQASTADAAATALQSLFRELDRPRNIIRWQPQGVSNPVFFRTFRTDVEALAPYGRPDNRRKTLQVNIRAEPFAYGLMETPVSGVTVSTNPATGINGCFVDVGGGFWLGLTGTSGDYASTPDDASLDITGDLDIRADMSMVDWTPAAIAYPVAKYTTTGDQRSYSLRVSTSGAITLGWSVTGVNIVTRTSTATIPIADGGRIAIRAVLDVDNGSGGHTATFYTALSVDGPWTQLGDPVVTAGTTSVFSGSAPLEIGSNTGGTAGTFAGRVFAAQVRNGIDGAVVANPDFTAQTLGVTSFADSTGKTWTVNGAAAIVGTPAVTGDVETPAFITWPASTIGGSNHQAVFAVRRRGTPSAAPFLIQAESMTQGTDTTTQANDANMSGAGNNFSRSTFATATMETRLSVTTVGIASTDLRGRYRVFLRYRRSSAVGAINVRLLWGATQFTSVTNSTSATVTTTNITTADLGEINIPQGWDPERGPDGVEVGVSNSLLLQLQAERTSGTSTIDFDFLVLVPADDRVGLVQWNAVVAALDHYRLDARDNSIHGRDASQNIFSVQAPSLVGGLPMLTPGAVNRIYMLRNVNAGSVWSLTTLVASVSYWPRYLSVRPATT